MSYSFHRIFCGTPGDLEPERDAFYDVMAEFNESEAMKHGILFVAVSIVPHLVNIPAFQSAIDENIRDCQYYVQVLGDTWGPPSRNFEGCFALARKCADDPALPMLGVVLMCKDLHPDRPADAAVIQSRKEVSQGNVLCVSFSDIPSFRLQLRALLAAWLPDVIAGRHPNP